MRLSHLQVTKKAESSDSDSSSEEEDSSEDEDVAKDQVRVDGPLRRQDWLPPTVWTLLPAANVLHGT